MRGCLIFEAVLLLQATLAVAYQSETPVLTPGASVDIAMSGGESYAWVVSLQQGQFFSAVIEQDGVDVEIELNAPDNRRIATFDSPNGRYGPEPLSGIATVPGDHRITVRAPNRKAETGKIRVRLNAVRAATEEDRRMTAADQAILSARAQVSSRDAGERAAALVSFGGALAYFRSSGDRYREGFTLLEMGLARARSADMRGAVEDYNGALALARSVGDSALEASALNNLGGAYEVLGEVDKALRRYEEARAIFRRLGRRASHANTLANIATLYHGMANWQVALRYYTEALQMLRDEGDLRREGAVLNGIGASYQALYDHERSLDYYRQALAVRQRSADKAGEATTLTNLGTVHARMNSFAEALREYDAAFKIQREIGDRRGEARTLLARGVALSNSGNEEEALEVLTQAVRLAEIINDRRTEAQSLGRLAKARFRSGDTVAARDLYQRAADAFESVSDGDNAGRVLVGMAEADLALGRKNEAMAHIATAASKIEQARKFAGAADTRASYFASSRDCYELYVDLLMLEGRNTEALEVTERARSRSLLEMLSESQADIRKGVDPALLERETELRNRINTRMARLVSGSDTELARMQDESDRLLLEVRATSPQYASLTQPKVLTAGEIQSSLDEGSVLLQYWLASQRSWLWVVTAKAISTFELPGRARIEEVAQRVSEFVSARAARPAGEMAAQRSIRILAADSALAGSSRELSRMVLGPAAKLLNDSRLIIASDGILQRVPFSLLPVPAGEAPLIVTHELTTIPSASALVELRRQLAGRPQAARMLAVFADPVFDTYDPRLKFAADKERTRGAETSSEDRLLIHSGIVSEGRIKIPRLPYTRREANAILDLAPSRSRLAALDFQATRRAVLDTDLRQYRYLHFATHGFIDSDHPALSGIALSMVNERGEPENGFVRLSDVYNLKLGADLVVLSACETGLGKQVTGEGIVGLTRGFLYAGSPRVVVSLWNVNDQGTAELMTRFYRHLIKEQKPAAAALREAQVELWKSKRWSAPFYWAAFVQHGEWR